MKRFFVLTAVVLGSTATIFGTGRAVAQLEPSFRIEPRAGEWMVLAASYSGPDAPELANQLAALLRREHRLPAYVWNYTDKDSQQLRTHLERFHKSIRIERHWGVLVGGYKSMNEANEVMKKTIRTLPLPKLRLRSGRNPYDMQWVVDPNGRVRQAEANPFRTSMVVRNPSIKSARKEAKYDPLWEKLNANEEFSLLRCPKPWTLAIKQYAGAGMIQSAQREKQETSLLGKLWPFSKDSNDAQMLNAAAAQAHELARVLRKVGFDAYVLHTRYNSVVTVGGFDTGNDARMPQMARQLKAFVKQVKGSNNGRDPIGLFAEAMPMEVPRTQ